MPIRSQTKPNLYGNYCWPHMRGVPPGTPKFFVKDCITCEAKLVAGKVTGQEAPPPSLKEMLATRSPKQRRAAQLRIKTREPGATL